MIGGGAEGIYMLPPPCYIAIDGYFHFFPNWNLVLPDLFPVLCHTHYFPSPLTEPSIVEYTTENSDRKNIVSFCPLMEPIFNAKNRQKLTIFGDNEANSVTSKNWPLKL